MTDYFADTASPVIKAEAGEHNNYSPAPLPRDRVFDPSQVYAQQAIQPMVQGQADTIAPRTHATGGESSPYFWPRVALRKACD